MNSQAGAGPGGLGAGPGGDQMCRQWCLLGGVQRFEVCLAKKKHKGMKVSHFCLQNDGKMLKLDVFCFVLFSSSLLSSLNFLFS